MSSGSGQCQQTTIRFKKISMIKFKLSFFELQNSEGHGSHGNKGTILFLGSVNVLLSAISTKLYFVEIS